MALNSRERFLNACACQSVDRPPLWLMRQAGRALPEYRALKQTHTFLDLVRTPDLTTEVTLQPIRRFGFDAAILFSDILVVPEALGQPYQFRETGGVEMAFPIRRREDWARLRWHAMLDYLPYVSQALRQIRQELGPSTALLGFSGSPWTLANFMVEGGSAPEFTRARSWWREDEPAFIGFLEHLTEAVSNYLNMQVDAGADAVQIFDSLGNALDASEYEAASGQWIKRIVQSVAKRVPVIVFVRGPQWATYAQSAAQVLGVDWQVSLTEMCGRIPSDKAIQGNLNPELMTQAPEVVERAARSLLTCMNGRKGYIVNLGHGLPPLASLASIEQLVEVVRNFAWVNSK
jgi:uroporphyrinogen decarboxylase